MAKYGWDQWGKTRDIRSGVRVHATCFDAASAHHTANAFYLNHDEYEQHVDKHYRTIISHRSDTDERFDTYKQICKILEGDV